MTMPAQVPLTLRKRCQHYHLRTKQAVTVTVMSERAADGTCPRPGVPARGARETSPSVGARHFLLERVASSRTASLPVRARRFLSGARCCLCAPALPPHLSQPTVAVPSLGISAQDL